VNLFERFPAARYRLEYEVEQPVRLPEFAGSALRGAFGHALKRAACVTHEPDCRACLLYRTCPYPAVFETPPPEAHTRRVFSSVPNPFVVEPPSWGARDYAAGDLLNFSLVLIGPALKQLPLILLAWQRALARGIGPGEGTARLLRVALDGDSEPIYQPGSGPMRAHNKQLPAASLAAPLSELTLHFDTPLRLQRDGHVLGVAKLEPHDLLAALIRRVANLCEFQLGMPLDLDFPGLNTLAANIHGDKDLRWQDWTRYSARQKQPMTLGGALGDWTLRGELAPFLPFLHLGQWLHVGKNASFGLGSYRISPVESVDKTVNFHPNFAPLS